MRGDAYLHVVHPIQDDDVLCSANISIKLQRQAETTYHMLYCMINNKKSLSEATELAKLSTELLNVSEFTSIDEATKALVSATQAYSDVKPEEIINKLNLVGEYLNCLLITISVKSYYY